MSRAQLAAKTCTIAQAIEIVGDEWTLMILREMFLGVRRFDQLQRQTGASPHLVSQRLKRLEREAIIGRQAYCEHPPRHEYRLTEKGRGLWPVIIALKLWGDQWLGHGLAAPVEIIHKACGQAIRPQTICPDCGEEMQATDARPRLSTEFQTERQLQSQSER